MIFQDNISTFIEPLYSLNVARPREVKLLKLTVKKPICIA
jgi:hypothetical protein